MDDEQVGAAGIGRVCASSSFLTHVDAPHILEQALGYVVIVIRMGFGISCMLESSGAC